MNKKWFRIGMAGVLLLSLALRFWGLGRFNTFVFDEVYYAKFGNNYLTHTPFFDGHPPLGKYMIGLGIWISSHIPFWQDEVNGFTGSVMSPISYRWMNAFSGSFIPIIVAAIAYQISYRRSFALLAGLFTACDGIFLVESRYALINQYIIIFGLLGQWFLLLALAKQRQQRNLWLILSGIAFGASAATKWNGLWFLLGVYLIWILAWGIRWLQSFRFIGEETQPQLQQQFLSHRSFTSDGKKGRKKSFSLSSLTLFTSGLSGKRIYKIFPYKVGFSTTSNGQANLTPLQKLTQLNIIHIIIYLGIIPSIVYSLIWIPHLLLDTRYGFIEVHRQILLFHERLGGNSPKVHPYCAAWYKWPLMTRPMAYFYQTAQSTHEALPVMGPPLPSGTGKIIYDVHAMGNPFLWWFGVAALLFLTGMLVWRFVIPWVRQRRFFLPTMLCVDTWIALYLVINYAANLLPWVKVNRCVFIYHYMTAVVFAFLAIAWLVDQCLRSYRIGLRALGVTITFMIVIAFVFWMPIYLGLPLSPFEYRPMRMWFNSWI
ncbi:glycosyl transferase family protein [Scytonema sp. HK-05]|uniref:dolichyl-phosphate-mannose--protein mannosyltransferase n=1 Tax=Scytonema sp. HK-05 TaxID=1137095 RepID=UPI000935CEB1|nr:phospholipid carrier-dependent glycosyltransferase [Scytonema sp. HK-05]OKH59240.1 dolichyl-phosphate-mannose--protein O-mannosyl transferase [Scytonema sp. HK-05]BAY45365.1 glycosyl transferase family protein [Scytonema sp. HK-05]